MKFIFPQNYDFKNKLFGIIDYSTVLVNLVWDILIFALSNIIFSSWTIKIFVIVIFCFPLLLFSFIGFNGENILYFSYYIIKFFIRPKLYLYKKF